MRALQLAVAPAILAAMALGVATANAQMIRWKTIVNNGDTIPGAAATFSSYGQPSVNSAGLVVFRARSGGSGGGESSTLPAGGGPIHGIFERDMAERGSPIVTVLQRGGIVPKPNNLDATFNEFPSIPRIAAHWGTMATRGQSTPVWEYTVDGQDTRIGTAGIYMSRRQIRPFTSMSQLGAVPRFSYFQVPNAPAGTKFDQFPGAPSPGRYKIAFKGNWTDANGVTQTGVYYRNFVGGDGVLPVRLIADTSTVIPNQPAGGTGTFGSTAPPSVDSGKMVFVGWDNEDAPTMGGIYMANLKPNSPLTALIGIGDDVPGVSGATFTNFGEGVSFDGRYVSFWGTWGTQTRTITLICPTDGNQGLIAYCLQQYPNGFQTTEPVNQGIFVIDTTTGQITLAANTGVNNYYNFMYWVYSGMPPGTGGGGEDVEPPRWRSSAFTALSTVGDTYMVAFKATLDNATQGIYYGMGPDPALMQHMVVDTTMPAAQIDPDVNALISATPLTVTSVGIERDGFRNLRLTMAITMANADASVSWAGLYVADMTSLSQVALGKAAK